MNDWWDRLIDATGVGTNKARLRGALANVTESLGFDGYAFLHVAPHQSFAVSNYAPPWQGIYFERNYQSVDPVVLRAKSLTGAFAWSGDDTKSRFTKEQVEFYMHASEFGIRSGVTIPVRTPNGCVSMFTLASGKPAIGLERDIDAIAAAAAVGQLHARLSHLDVEPSVEEPVYLDPKAAAYLRWVAAGKSMEETACIEGVKYNSVRVKLADTKKHFNVHTMTHLLAIAIRRGLI